VSIHLDFGQENKYFSMKDDPIPLLRFDCGRDDILIEYNRILYKALDNSIISHKYQ
jgi:hypothetical protein